MRKLYDLVKFRNDLESKLQNLDLTFSIEGVIEILNILKSSNKHDIYTSSLGEFVDDSACIDFDFAKRSTIFIFIFLVFLTHLNVLSRYSFSLHTFTHRCVPSPRFGSGFGSNPSGHVEVIYNIHIYDLQIERLY